MNQGLYFSATEELGRICLFSQLEYIKQVLCHYT